MKQNRLLAIAMAGAVLTGTFAVPKPVSAEDTTITTESYTLVIARSATVSDGEEAGKNTLQVTVKDCGYNVSDVTVTASSGNAWQLVSGENAVAYGLYDADSEEAVTEHTFSEYYELISHDGETWNCEIKLTDDAENIQPGDYKDTITWTASVNEFEDTDGEDSGYDIATASDMTPARDLGADSIGSEKASASDITASDAHSTDENTEGR